MLCSQPLYATEAPGLFDIEIVAHGEAAEDRSFAIRQGLYAVLERIIGADDIAKIPVVQQMLKSAEQYVKQSHFTAMSAAGETDIGLRRFRVEFDEDQIMDVLKDQQLVIWGETRPKTLVWLVVDSGEGKQYYNAEALPEFESVLNQLSKLKAVPLVFPILDIEEQQKVSVNDVASISPDNLLAASVPYDVPAILAGQVVKQGECWLSDWQFLFDAKIKRWSSSCLPLKPTISAGIRGIFAAMSLYYGAKPEASSAK